jgi:mitogen-activated protein kinase 1/3
MQYILYQLLKAVKYMHSAQIVHRDIKPSNILATENCEICFCDFGLARQIEESDAEDDKNAHSLTEYVVTRYYRAPEVMLSSHEYSTAIDIWSLGCAFAELLTRNILFKGTNYIQMIKMIFETLGKPPMEELSFITNQNARKYV